MDIIFSPSDSFDSVADRCLSLVFLSFIEDQKTFVVHISIVPKEMEPVYCVIVFVQALRDLLALFKAKYVVGQI